MKKGLLILAAALIAGILAFFLSRGQQSSTGHDSVLLDSMPELAWLRADLKLTDEQFSKVEQLHRDYRPLCAEMCRRISESKAAVAKLASTRGSMSDELIRAIENHGHVIASCKRSMLEHMYNTASVMDEQQARRYLEISLPLALDSASGRTTTSSHE
jgi:hypothetical protein